LTFYFCLSMFIFELCSFDMLLLCHISRVSVKRDFQLYFANKQNV